MSMATSSDKLQNNQSCLITLKRNLSDTCAYGGAVGRAGSNSVVLHISDEDGPPVILISQDAEWRIFCRCGGLAAVTIMRAWST